MMNYDESNDPAKIIKPEDNYAQQFGVIVLCEDESKQEQTYNFLKNKGYTVKVVNT